MARQEIKKPATRIIIEATERLEHAFIFACSKANLSFVVANPLRVKKFAGAMVDWLKPITLMQI